VWNGERFNIREAPHYLILSPFTELFGDSGVAQ
jgi:hypothetical protein